LRNTFKKGADYSIPKFCGSLRTFALAWHFDPAARCLARLKANFSRFLCRNLLLQRRYWQAAFRITPSVAFFAL
jgi:hypothetical protein